MIVAHLDLDAFFAAVEELEDPSLRRKPLVVGGDPHGRGVVATANYVARRYGIHSAMSCAEALRRCPEAVFVRPRHALYRDYSRAVWTAIREVVPTVERTGLDEGYLDLGEVAADFLGARRVAEAVQAAVRGADRADLLARRRDDEGRREGRVRPAQARRADRRAGRAGRPRSSRRSTSASSRASARAPRSACAPPASRRSARSPRSTTRALRRLLPGKVGTMLRDRARGIDPRGLETHGRADLDLDGGDLRARHRRPRAAARRAPPDGRRLAEHLEQAAARRPGPSRRRCATRTSRSAAAPRRSPPGSTTATRSATSPARCSTARSPTGPGPLRLVGVGVSNLEPFRQLALS